MREKEDLDFEMYDKEINSNNNRDNNLIRAY